MKLLFIINTPAQAHTWKNVIKKLTNNGHSIKILARDYGSTPLILSACGLTFKGHKTVGARYSRLLGVFRHFRTCYKMSREFSPSLVIGFGIDAALTAARFRKPSLVFIDNDQTRFQNFLTRSFGSVIITPDCFKGDLGKNQIRIRGFKELTYLHPRYFNPDAAVLDKLEVKNGEKYIIMRFSALDAVHDIGKSGFSSSDKLLLVKELEKHARVFISPEAELPPALKAYQLTVPYENFHDALHYAQMYVGSAGTAATEAAVLGTPVLALTRRKLDMGNFEEMSRRGLMYIFRDVKPALEKAVELLHNPNLKQEWACRRSKLLSNTVDVTDFMVGSIENMLWNTTGKMISVNDKHLHGVVSGITPDYKGRHGQGH